MEPAPKNLERVALQVGGDYSRWAFVQWQLRERAANKFTRACEMLFTRDGLEMASHEVVARLHASFYDHGPVTDLTCGIGADLIGIAAAGKTPIGLDLNREHVACATHNLKIYGHRGRAVCADSSLLTVTNPKRNYFLDPQRRSGGRRLTDPSQFSPNPEAILERLKRFHRLVIKLSPMTDDSFLESFGGTVWFVTHQRQCCEALVVKDFGRTIQQGGAVHAETQTFLAAKPIETTLPEAGAFLLEADAAAIRGHCLGSFGLSGLGDSNGYLTSSESVDSIWLRNHRVLWQGAWRIDKVRTALSEMNARVVAVKCRGVDIGVEKVGKELRMTTGNPVVLILYPMDKTIRAVIATEAL